VRKFIRYYSLFASKFEHLTNKVNTDIVDIKGLINAIDQIIEGNKVTIKEASDALKRSKEEERVVSDELSHTQEIDNKFKSNTLLEQTHFNTNTKSTENVNHNSNFYRLG
jgi:predicted ATP-grasp superfamily ATP-dependent carboligase